MSQTIKLIALAVMGLFASVMVNAQVTTSAISGKLVDSEGPVQGAAIIAVHTPSGSQFTAVSDKNGNYRINNITPGGPYTVRIEVLGYRSVENTGVYAPLGETIAIENTLEVEALGLEAAVFTADAADSGMNIERSGASTSISQRQMNAMPTVSRNLNDIMKLTPQASETSNGFAVGGGNYRSSYVTVDGAAFNNAFGIGSNLPAGGSPISLDALELMSVNITPYDVRQSGFTGAAINAVTKSGTNTWHASVYNYYNSDQLEGDRISKDDDGKLTLSRSLDNTTGVTVGGPIIKDKLFFFLNAEYTPESTPGNRYVASTDGNMTGNIARPTESFMNEVSSYLQNTFGYNPGRYQNYSVATPDWKLMARIDWNINKNHKLNARFSHTVNSYSASPSSSTSPLYFPNIKNNRLSSYAMYFESSRYIQNQNFTSAALELNSRFLEGALNNTLRLTYSYQNETRDHYGDVFPTVDILDGTGTSVMTTFGLDPFTYGNLRQVSTVIATDEISYNIGINNIIAGLQFEWNDVKNGYMQGGAGYYTYGSWQDFMDRETVDPVAFVITFPNNDALDQVYPSFRYMQASIYAQDEITFSDRFKLTAGIRFELPFYPTVPNNNNKDFATIADGSQTMQGLRTDDMPKARLGVSPRVGFNWDILGNRNLILRGGTGIFTGRIPFVWIVSSVGNSNNIQIQYSKQPTGTNDVPGFHTNVKDIVNDIYGGSFTRQDAAAPSQATIMDKNLKMPTTWKTSLALDARLPGGIKATLEGVFNKDLYTVVARKLGIVAQEGTKLPGEPEARNGIWKSEGLTSSLQGASGDIQPFYLTNTDGVNGYYGSFTAQLQKDFNFGLSLMAAYTYSKSMSVSEGIGDQVSSSFKTMNYSKFGSNTPELGHSAYVSPNRFIANISYRIEYGKKGATTLGLFYEGYNHCYFADQYSYTRYSYVMNDVTGAGGANIPIYIPTEAELAQMPFVSEENKAAFNDFIKNDKYLSKHRGEYSKRGAIVAPWQSRFNFKFAQDINFQVCGKTNTIQVGLDIYNVANLLNPNWGKTDNFSNDRILTYDTDDEYPDPTKPYYEFTAPEKDRLSTTYNTWSMLLSLKYFF